MSENQSTNDQPDNADQDAKAVAEQSANEPANPVRKWTFITLAVVVLLLSMAYFFYRMPHFVQGKMDRLFAEPQASIHGSSCHNLFQPAMTAGRGHRPGAHQRQHPFPAAHHKAPADAPMARKSPNRDHR